jgi:hypothetical protein
MSDMTHLSRLRADQLLNDELAAVEAHAARAHVASCDRCTARIAEHERERAELAVPLASRRRPRAAWIAAAAFAAAAVIVLVALRARGPHGVDEGGTRLKGAPAIGFYVKHGDAVRRGADGELVAPGDAIELTATSARPAYLAIVSVDHAGTVSVYYPDAPVAAPIAAGAEQVLPTSVILDDVLGRERIYGVFCPDPIAVAEVRAAFAGSIAPPRACVVATTTIEKRAAP